MNKFFIVLVFLFFAWVINSQHQSAMNATQQDLLDVRMETRARNILSGGYIGE
jgi:hypothetical protein